MKSRSLTVFAAISASAALLLGACGAGKKASGETPKDIPVIPTKPMMKIGAENNAVPRATVFKMNGDYAGNVAVTLNDDGTLSYYPAPSDLTSLSSPLPLGDGWYLNRQGIGPKSVFTTYTFDEYRNLPSAPSHEEILKAVIPGSSVTDFCRIPVDASEALANPDLCLPFLESLK